jgi:S-adenosylmethionine:tRNA ribosyltransferase-isomerase
LESLYWLGVGKTLDQWTGYGESAKSRKEALENLKGPILTRTQLLVAPGYRPRIADALITNFHQPGSTLLLLVAALLGEDWKKVYQYALQQDFRFLSYGDGSLLWF